MHQNSDQDSIEFLRNPFGIPVEISGEIHTNTSIGTPTQIPIGTRKSFPLFITAKTITKLNLGHGDKFEKKKRFKNLAVVVHALQKTHNLFISSCCFAEDGKEMYKEL